MLPRQRVLGRLLLLTCVHAPGGHPLPQCVRLQVPQQYPPETLEVFTSRGKVQQRSDVFTGSASS